jgi:hypothetical protein
MAWHERNQNDPAHQWFREITMRCAAGVHDGKLEDDEDQAAPVRARRSTAVSGKRRKSRRRQ